MKIIETWRYIHVVSCIKKDTRWGILWCCHGNNLGSSLFLLWTKNCHLWLYNERKKDLLTTHTMPLLCLVSSLTIKHWTMFVKPKKGMSFSQERGQEAQLLHWQHHNMHYSVSFLRYITAAKFQLQRLNISRDTYILDFMICLYTYTVNHLWRHDHL